MKYKILGNSGINVSIIGLGTWAIGSKSTWGWKDDDEKHFVFAIQEAVDNGINLIDTAPIYGDGVSEKVVGKAIQGRREKVVISTKVGLRWDSEHKKVKKILKSDSIKEEIENSLCRLGVDCIDLYQCHWPDNFTSHEEVANTLLKLKREGKIRAIGVSNYNVTEMKEFSKYVKLDSLQTNYSLLERKIEKIILPWCNDNGVSVLTYGSLGGGMLTGKYNQYKLPNDNRSEFYKHFTESNYSNTLSFCSKLERFSKDRGIFPAQMAIAWIISKRGITSAIVGAKNKEQVKMNLKASDIILSQEEINFLNNESNIF